MKGIVITSDKSEVFTLYNSKNEDKIRERLKFFRGRGIRIPLCARGITTMYGGSKAPGGITITAATPTVTNA